MNFSQCNSKNMIVFQEINKWYKPDFHALKNIHGVVQKGEVIVVCGPSGSGKSTLIRTVNRLEEIQGGKIELDGQDIYSPHLDINKFRSSIGFVFQNFNLFPHLSAAENIMLAPTNVQGMSKVNARQRALEMLDRVGLASKADSYPGQLSGGQQQRVAIARALVLAPPVMLFDEPTSALDPELIGEVLQVIKSLARDGMTMMCVTHEMNFAREVADKVWFLDAGQLIESCTPDNFFNHAQSERAQKFLADLPSH